MLQLHVVYGTDTWPSKQTPLTCQHSRREKGSWHVEDSRSSRSGAASLQTVRECLRRCWSEHRAPTASAAPGRCRAIVGIVTGSVSLAAGPDTQCRCDTIWAGIVGLSILRPSIRPFIRSFVHSSICLSIRPSIHSFVCSSVCLSVRPFIHLFICSSICLSVRPFIHSFVCSSVCLSVHPFARSFVDSSLNPAAN